VAVARYFGNPVEPVTSSASDIRLWPQQIWAPRTAFKGIDLSRVESVGLATAGSGRAWFVDASSRGARPAPKATALPTASISDFTQTVTPGQTTVVPYEVRLDRAAPNGARIRVWMDGSSAISAVDETAIVPPGGKSATVEVEVNAPGDFAADTVAPWIYTTRGATVGRWTASFTVNSYGLSPTSIPRLVARDPVAVAEPGESLVWSLSPRNATASISAEVRAVSSSLDFSDLDPGFRARRGLPDSGRIGADDPLVLESRRAGSGGYRITLPLSDEARVGTSIDLALVSISGARGVGTSAFSGFVVDR
jgi:hypothetical protein